MGRVIVFTGNANRKLAADICAAMHRTGVTDAVLGRATVGAFSDGETRVQIEENVRDADVYVVQPTSAPANHHLMELVIMIDALRRASAGSITAVIPYYGYARQERKPAPRTPITAALAAEFIAVAGADRVVAMDLHAPAIQGFFRRAGGGGLPVDNLYALPALLPYLTDGYSDAVVVSPDAGGVARARAYAKAVGDAPLAIIDKRRERANESEVMNVVGEVEGRRCLVIDDMIDTSGTLVKGVEALLKRGALSVAACATHGVFSGEAASRIHKSALVEVVVTDTVALRGDALLALETTGRIKVVSVAPLIGEAIRRIHHGESVSSLFEVA